VAVWQRWGQHDAADSPANRSLPECGLQSASAEGVRRPGCVQRTEGRTPANSPARFALLSALAAAALAGCSRSGSGVRLSSADKGVSQTAANPDRLPQFHDVTAKAGIRFTHVSGASERRYVPETMGAGCAFLDFNADGWLDVLLLNDRPLAPASSQTKPQGSRPTAALYRNNGDGSFTDVTAGSGLDVVMEAMGCAVGDYDNDGREDVYITDALNDSRLFHNDGAAGASAPGFRDVTAEAGVANRGHWGTSCAWLDYDRDGWLDLFVGNYVRYSVAADRPCYQQGRRYYCRPTSYPPDTCTLYRNLGPGQDGRPRFADVTRAAGIYKVAANALGVAVWDVDRDGWSDIIVANDLKANFLFHNQGNGTFQERALEWGVAHGDDGKARAGMGIDVADVRSNGRAAAMIGNFAGEPLSFFYQEDPPYFTDITYEVGTGEQHLHLVGFGLCFVDYDNDGFKDAFVVNGHIEPDPKLIGESSTYGQRNNLFRNRRDGTMEEVSDRSGTPFTYQRVGRGAACGDFDNDGHPDLLVSNNGGPAELLRNDGAGSGHWLQITLRGAAGVGRQVRGVSQDSRATSTDAHALRPPAPRVAAPNASNRSGIGAVVQVQVGRQTQMDVVRSGSSYCSASMLRLHFGLGAARHADRVTVKWPGGAEQTLTTVRADQLLTLEEPPPESR
jgi:enediyne biosynthesis protein E4